MEKIQVLGFCALLILAVFNLSVLALPPTQKTIPSSGSIWISGEVGQFSIRIADMMADLLPPNFDNPTEGGRWQSALDDLTVASSQGEITHVQMRIWWYVDPNDPSTWNYPQLGSQDPGQASVFANWQRWYFGVGMTELSAIERIHNAGFQYEFCVSVAWGGLGTLADLVDPWRWGASEDDYESFDGDIFLQNYMNDVLRPVALFLANDPNFENGDIFMLNFENVYPTADFTWRHNERWTNMIQEVRQIFANVGKSGVLLTIDHSCWYDDRGLGYNAVTWLSRSIDPSFQGISGASYLGELDFLSLSVWLPLISEDEIPETWTDADIAWVADRWFNNLREGGLNIIEDMEALSAVLGVKCLMNTGWANSRNTLALAGQSMGGPEDYQSQRVAWGAQLEALRRSIVDQNKTWCAGQDFERYCRGYPQTRIGTSWRGNPAESMIMEKIRDIVS